MKLSDLKTGEHGIIVKVSGHGSFRKRITEMGFVKGKEVRVVLNAPLMDPIEYEIIGYRISLRRAEAESIEVVSREEAREILTGEKPSDAASLTFSEEITEQEKAVMKELAESRRHIIKVALVGNPNCGKTSLFNIASGSHEHVGNYSGVTVDAKEGRFEHNGYKFIIVDLPGTYSLSAYSPEELYVRNNLINDSPDVVVNVVDASNIERNLYLTTQLIDMDLRVVMALNMYDEMTSRGDKLDTSTLGHLLGIPIVPTISKSGAGIPELFDKIINVYEHNDPKTARHIHINHGPELEASIDRIRRLIKTNSEIKRKYSTRYLAIKYLENDRETEHLIEEFPNRDEIIAARYEEEKRIERLLGASIENTIVDSKYGFIQGALKETFRSAEEKKRRVLQIRSTPSSPTDGLHFLSSS